MERYCCIWWLLIGEYTLWCSYSHRQSYCCQGETIRIDKVYKMSIVKGKINLAWWCKQQDIFQLRKYQTVILMSGFWNKSNLCDTYLRFQNTSTENQHLQFHHETYLLKSFFSFPFPVFMNKLKFSFEIDSIKLVFQMHSYIIFQYSNAFECSTQTTVHEVVCAISLGNKSPSRIWFRTFYLWKIM